jgi:hypothetical protein
VKVHTIIAGRPGTSDARRTRGGYAAPPANPKTTARGGMGVLTEMEIRALSALDESAMAAHLLELLAVPSMTGADAESALQHRLADRLRELDLDVDLWSMDLPAIRALLTCLRDRGLADETDWTGERYLSTVDRYPVGQPSRPHADAPPGRSGGSLMVHNLTPGSCRRYDLLRR